MVDYLDLGLKNGYIRRKGDPCWDLSLANTFELASIFSNCHDTIWEGGKKNPAESFDEMSKLMFCKLRDERDCRENEFYQFQVKTDEEPKSVAKRIREIYARAKTKDPDIFKTKIDLDDEIIYGVVLKMQSISLSKSDIDAKGRAFETFMGKIFRGELGQFFTPREIVQFMVHMIEPTSADTIIDPSCGSGGFLLHSLDLIREAEGESARANLYGIEINHQIARVAMMDMILHDDENTAIVQGDGLAGKGEGKYSVVLQNPPFGHMLKLEEKPYLKRYELMANKSQISSLILFIERAFTFLKPGGKMGIVVPDSIMTNSTTQYVRDYIRQHFIILAIVSLPKQTFMPSGVDVKTSLLFLRKKTRAEYLQKSSYPVFMAVAKHVGYDATGKSDKNDLYLTDPHGKIMKDQGILGEYKKFKAGPDAYPTSNALQLIKSTNG